MSHPLANRRTALFCVIVLDLILVAAAANGSREPSLQVAKGQPLVVQSDVARVTAVHFRAGDGDSFHLKAPNDGHVSPDTIKVSEDGYYYVSGVELEGGTTWFLPFKRFPEGQGVNTTLKWQLVLGGAHFADRGQKSWTGVPTEEEWHKMYLDSIPYPHSGDEFSNTRRRIELDFSCILEGFNEGANDIDLYLWGSTYVKVNDWTTPTYENPVPVVWKRIPSVHVSGQVTIVVERPYKIWKSPMGDAYTFPHVATLTVDLMDSNTTRTEFKGNDQDYEVPTVRLVGSNGTIAPGESRTTMSDTRTHDGTHPPALIHVLPDFAPIAIDVYHRVWDVPANKGREYHRLVTLNPTALFCKDEGDPESTPGEAPPPTAPELTTGGLKLKHSVRTPGAVIQPYGSLGSVPIGAASVRVRIVSMALGRPTQYWDATPDDNGEWVCQGCLWSGDQAELQYEFRDIFGRHYTDAITVAVPDSFDLAAPDTVELGQPFLVLTETEIDPDPVLQVVGRVYDLGAIAFDVLHPVAGAIVSGGDEGEVLTDANGTFAFAVPHGTILNLAVSEESGAFLPLVMPPTPPIEANLNLSGATAEELQDDRMYLWLTPSFAAGSLHPGSGAIDLQDDGSLVSHVGAVSNLDPAAVLEAYFETLDGDFVAPARIHDWGATPPPNLPFVPALFALAEDGSGGVGKSDPAFQAALQAVIAAGGARLHVLTGDGNTHVMDLPLEQPGLSGVDDIPTRPALVLQAAPNPFNPATTLSFTLAEAGPVQLDIFQVDGRRVATLVDAHLAAGPHRIDWRGKDDHGASAASGVYVARLRAGGREATRRMVLVR